MKTTERFEKAVMKLYNAFHNNELNAMHCQHCAVGNICNNEREWDDLGVFASDTIFGDGTNWNVDAEKIKESLDVINKTGYSAQELVEVERLFLEACEYQKGTKHLQFKGLCAVVEYLAKLDNIPNPMDYTKLFETENDKPIYELTF
jgi:hypothetical protein